MNKEIGSDLDIALFKDNYIHLDIFKQEFNSIVIEKMKKDCLYVSELL